MSKDLMFEASRRLALMRTEKGDLPGAYVEARRLLARRPENSDAHFILSYTLRYAGLLSESARECEKARALDPSNSSCRSCALTFLMLGDIPRARQFADLDPKSEWRRGIETYILLRQVRNDDALRAMPSVSGVRHEDGLISLTVGEPRLVVPALLDYLRGSGLDLADLTIRSATLEDVFVALTGRHLRDDNAV